MQLARGEHLNNLVGRSNEVPADDDVASHNGSRSGRKYEFFAVVKGLIVQGSEIRWNFADL